MSDVSVIYVGGVEIHVFLRSRNGMFLEADYSSSCGLQKCVNDFATDCMCMGRSL